MDVWKGGVLEVICVRTGNTRTECEKEEESDRIECGCDSRFS